MSQRKDLLLLDLTGLVLTQLIMLGLFFVFAEGWMYFVLWALPAATLTSFFNAVRALVEHFNEEGDTVPVDERLYSIQSSWIERIFFGPFNFNYHAEHHLAPAVSAFCLPRYRERYLSEVKMRLRDGYLTTLWRIGRLVISDRSSSTNSAAAVSRPIQDRNRVRRPGVQP